MSFIDKARIKAISLDNTPLVIQNEEALSGITRPLEDAQNKGESNPQSVPDSQS